MALVAKVIGELHRGLHLWWRVRRYDAVITDTSLHVALFALLQRLRFLPPKRHLVLECLWERSPNRVIHILKSLQFKSILSPWTRAVIYA